MNVPFGKPTEVVTVESTVTHTPPGASAPVTEVVDVTPVAAVPSTSLVPQAPAPVSPHSAPLISDEEINFKDIILPRINIVQKVGELSNIFDGGVILLNQELVIHEPGDAKNPGWPPLIFTVLGFRKRQYVEKIEGGEQGLLLNDPAEVVRKGGTLDWKEWDEAKKAVEAKVPGAKPIRLFQELATALILIERPANLAAQDPDNIHFPYECEGKQFALAFWAMKGVAFTNAAKPLFTARKIGHLKTGYCKQAWSLTTKLEQYGKNFAYRPVIKPAAKSSEAFLEFVALTMEMGR